MAVINLCIRILRYIYASKCWFCAHAYMNTRGRSLVKRFWNFMYRATLYDANISKVCPKRLITFKWFCVVKSSSSKFKGLTAGSMFFETSFRFLKPTLTISHSLFPNHAPTLFPQIWPCSSLSDSDSDRYCDHDCSMRSVRGGLIFRSRGPSRSRSWSRNIYFRNTSSLKVPWPLRPGDSLTVPGYHSSEHSCWRKIDASVYKKRGRKSWVDSGVRTVRQWDSVCLARDRIVSKWNPADPL